MRSLNYLVNIYEKNPVVGSKETETNNIALVNSIILVQPKALMNILSRRERASGYD